MKDDVERELKQVQEFIEALERYRPPEDTGDDHPDSSVPAPVKRRPRGAIGGEALLEPDGDDTPLRQQKDLSTQRMNVNGSLANPHTQHPCPTRQPSDLGTLY